MNGEYLVIDKDGRESLCRALGTVVSNASQIQSLLWSLPTVEQHVAQRAESQRRAEAAKEVESPPAPPVSAPPEGK